MCRRDTNDYSNSHSGFTLMGYLPFISNIVLPTCVATNSDEENKT